MPEATNSPTTFSPNRAPDFGSADLAILLGTDFGQHSSLALDSDDGEQFLMLSTEPDRGYGVAGRDGLAFVHCLPAGAGYCVQVADPKEAFEFQTVGEVIKTLRTLVPMRSRHRLRG